MSQNDFLITVFKLVESFKLTEACCHFDNFSDFEVRKEISLIKSKITRVKKDYIRSLIIYEVYQSEIEKLARSILDLARECEKNIAPQSIESSEEDFTSQLHPLAAPCYWLQENYRYLEKSDISLEKEKLFIDAVEFHQVACEWLERHVIINPSGTAKNTVTIKGFKLYKDCCMKDWLCRFYSDNEILYPEAIKFIQITPGIKLVSCENKSDNVIECKIEFPTPLIPISKKVDFGIILHSHNSFKMSSWEIEEFKDFESHNFGKYNYEYISTQITYPCKNLKMILSLPSILENPKPFLRCKKPKNLPKINDYRQLILQYDETYWEPNATLTEIEKGNLNENKNNDDPYTNWELKIDHPVTGFEYEIRWNVKDVKEGNTPLLIIRETAAYRKILLKYRDKCLHNPRSRVRKKIREPLTKLFTEFEKHFKSRVNAAKDRLSLSLMVYDQTDKTLAVVETIRNWRCPPNWTFKIPYGEGLAGSVFKQRLPLLYYTKSNTDSEDTVFLYHIKNEQTNISIQYEALLGIPLCHPEFAWKEEYRDPIATIGVMCFGSTSEDSRILELLEEDYESDKNNMTIANLRELAQGTFQVACNCLKQ